MLGTLIVREAVNDVSGHLILDANGRVIALCTHHADAVDLASAWNAKRQRAADVARTPQQEQELDVMKSRGEL